MPNLNIKILPIRLRITNVKLTSTNQHNEAGQRIKHREDRITKANVQIGLNTNKALVGVKNWKNRIPKEEADQILLHKKLRQ